MTAVHKIDGMAKKNLAGKYVLEPDAWAKLSALAKSGITARVAAGDWEQKWRSAADQAQKARASFDRLYQQARPFLEAVKIAWMLRWPHWMMLSGGQRTGRSPVPNRYIGRIRLSGKSISANPLYAICQPMKRSVVFLDKTMNSKDVPDHEVESLARCILPDIRAFFESEQGQREFAEWKARQEQDKQPEKS